MIVALGYVLNIALSLVAVAIVLCAVRLLLGPSAQDRVLALDSLWVCAMIFVLLLGIRLESVIYFELSLLIALLGFVSTMALAKFLMRGEIIE